MGSFAKSYIIHHSDKLPGWAGRESEKFIGASSSAGQLLAAAKRKYISRPKGVETGKLARVKTAPDQGLSMAETVSLTGIS